MILHDNFGMEISAMFIALEAVGAPEAVMDAIHAIDTIAT
jgi:hypothetical protein